MPRPVFREVGGRGQGNRAEKRAKRWSGGFKLGPARYEQSVSFGAFSGYFGFPQQQVAQGYRCSCAVQPRLPKISLNDFRGVGDPAMNKGDQS